MNFHIRSASIKLNVGIWLNFTYIGTQVISYCLLILAFRTSRIILYPIKNQYFNYYLQVFSDWLVPDKHLQIFSQCLNTYNVCMRVCVCTYNFFYLQQLGNTMNRKKNCCIVQSYKTKRWPNSKLKYNLPNVARCILILRIILPSNNFRGGP